MKWFLCFLLLLVTPVSARAETNLDRWTPQRELILISDASMSMYPPNSEHYKVQRDGYIKALQDPRVQAALLAAPTVVRVVYFGDRVHFRYNIGPVYLHDQSAIDDLIGRIEAGTPGTPLVFGTDQCAGVRGALALPRVGERRIYDVVTDEFLRQSHELDCARVRTLVEMAGDEINVLGIRDAGYEDAPVRFREHLVTNSPPGFFQRANSWSEFSDAIIAKLLAELLS